MFDRDREPTTVREREVETAPARRDYVDGPRYVAGPTPIDYIARIVKVVFAIIQALLVLRIVFLLLIANRDNQIVQTILSVTDPLVSPFVGMFRFNDVRTSSGVVLDVAAVVALIAWTIIEWIVLMILGIFNRHDTVADA